MKKYIIMIACVFLISAFNFTIYADDEAEKVAQYAEDHLVDYLKYVYLGDGEVENLTVRTISTVSDEQLSVIVSEMESANESLREKITASYYSGLSGFDNYYGDKSVSEIVNSYPHFFDLLIAYEQKLHLPHERIDFHSSANLANVEKIGDHLFYLRGGYGVSYTYKGQVQGSAANDQCEMVVWYDGQDFVVVEFVTWWNEFFRNYRFSDASVEEMIAANWPEVDETDPVTEPSSNYTETTTEPLSDCIEQRESGASESVENSGEASGSNEKDSDIVIGVVIGGVAFVGLCSFIIFRRRKNI